MSTDTIETNIRTLDEVLGDIDALVKSGVLNKSILVVQHGNGEVETFEFLAQPCQQEVIGP